MRSIKRFMLYLVAAIVTLIIVLPIVYAVLGGFRTNRQLIESPAGFPDPGERQKLGLDRADVVVVKVWADSLEKPGEKKDEKKDNEKKPEDKKTSGKSKSSPGAADLTPLFNITTFLRVRSV